MQDHNIWTHEKIDQLTDYLNSTESHDSQYHQEIALLAKLESALKDVLGLNNKAKGPKPKKF